MCMLVSVLVCVWVVWAKRKYTLEKLRIKQTNMKSQNKQSPSTSTRYKETKALGECAGEGEVTTTNKRENGVSKFQIYTQLFYYILFMFPPVPVTINWQTYQWYAANKTQFECAAGKGKYAQIFWGDLALNIYFEGVSLPSFPFPNTYHIGWALFEILGKCRRSIGNQMRLLYGLHRWRQLQAWLLFGLIVSSLVSSCCCCTAYIGELWWQLSNTGATGTAARCRCGTAARLFLLGMLLWCLKRRETRLSISTYTYIVYKNI